MHVPQQSIKSRLPYKCHGIENGILVSRLRDDAAKEI